MSSCTSRGDGSGESDKAAAPKFRTATGGTPPCAAGAGRSCLSAPNNELLFRPGCGLDAWLPDAPRSTGIIAHPPRRLDAQAVTALPPGPVRSLSRHRGWMLKDTCPFKLALTTHTHSIIYLFNVRERLPLSRLPYMLVMRRHKLHAHVCSLILLQVYQQVVRARWQVTGRHW